MNPLTAPNVGIAPGVNIAHEDPALINAFYSYARRQPLDVFTITSGDRESQPTSSPFPIAPEGTSNHERWVTGRGFDEAIDVVNGGVPIGETTAAIELGAFGLHLPVRSDPVHVTLLGVNG